MNKLISFAAVAAISLGQVAAAHALDLTAAVGRTGESTMTYRLGAQMDFNRSWFETGVGRLTGYWDAGYTYWEGDETSSNHSISLAPVFVYEFSTGSVKPYLEAGIGIAAFENTEIENNDLGSSFQFEDRFGAGLRFAGGQEIGLRAIHYSNAGIKDPNDGIETYALHYRASF
ncbi:MAG: acyloxyacyl hydrolase [Gammaproteobacteria bacterium]|jgi:lipid A 3-O-deacylase|uniref:acyloxyacyl hydrolase n=1 Tax=Pseudomonadaceae TaxID=135621 RepID=UPI000C398004|nr:MULTISPECIES: acyloxyacyl hydrolase [Pseudomonadaceae]MBK59199.1 acyloxyacyl hydrolase [Pseudomonas sp.]MBU0810565.1 acyloxyacyl hydrolase [Gammaproteobacteria bacterium]MBK3846788.1 acyloxyacyl hydrolase [Stutzerimonas xanthomarina]MBU0852382.1 acyloxyacyl hydrolase [Gammaproteobacteria bacterium]MBU1300529.1 acyloxyacyl hydrolase [Gammaproteobacteria bacterium]|tara:strand:- start:272 stop:790 length:519 start_codon:yes stop_codon:yes gene_type:complete